MRLASSLFVLILGLGHIALASSRSPYRASSESSLGSIWTRLFSGASEPSQASSAAAVEKDASVTNIVSWDDEDDLFSHDDFSSTSGTFESSTLTARPIIGTYLGPVCAKTLEVSPTETFKACSSCSFLIAALIPSTNQPNRVGVVAIPGGPAPDGWSYISASYIKFLEMSGVRVAPIFFDEHKVSLERKLRSVNGLLIPGGVDIDYDDHGPGEQLYNNLRYILGEAIRFNQQGSYFPVHGVGLGMEMILRYFSDDSVDFKKIDADDLAGPLIFEGTAVMSRRALRSGSYILRI